MENTNKKKTGIIRKGAVVPFIIVTVLVVGFSIFLLDGMIKRTLEYVGGKINGAEVNVANVTTSFKNLSVKIENIQVTNVDAPEMNLIQIGQVRFQMMWDALLRAKVVIDESIISDIQVATKRKSKGEVYPKEVSNSQEPSIATETFKNAQEEFKGNVFGDISAMLGGTDSKDVLKNIEGELKSKKFYENLEKQVDQKEDDLKQMMANLPKSSEINQYDDRFKAINWEGLKDIKKAPKILKEADSLRKDVSGAIKKYDEASKRVKSELDFVKESTKQAENLIKEDMKALESKMSIPSLDSESIANVLFGPEVMNNMQKYNKYFEMAKEYMPPKKEKEVTSVKTPRGAGRNYQFGTPTSYPLFWLKLASIDSKNDQGSVAGKIENITTDQRIVNKPMTAQIDGSFPSSGVTGVKATLSLDHRKEVDDSVNLSVASFPVAGKELSKSDSVTFTMAKAVGATNLGANLKGKTLTLNMNNVFTNIDYEVAAKSKHVQDLLVGVSEEAKRVTLDATASGSVDKLGFKIKTNLGELIKDAIGKVLQKKIDEAKARIRKSIDEKLAGNKAQIEEKTNSLKQKYLGELDKQKAKIDQLTAKIDGKKDSASDGLKNKGKDLLKSFKKKFKF